MSEKTNPEANSQLSLLSDSGSSVKAGEPGQAASKRTPPAALQSETPQSEASVTKSQAILSVEQLNLQIKQLLEGGLGKVWVRGEISNFKVHTSGHVYFSLKDQKSQISSVMFKGYFSRIKFKPRDGTEVLAYGRISAYEARGNYSLYVEHMESVGAGALQRAFEELRDKLKKEGLFDSAKKRPIPQFPKHIAIVTSKTGAAIKDILNILSRRAPHIQVTIIDTLVQGESAPPKIIEALQLAVRLSETAIKRDEPRIDAVIVGRGGGSIEDLWAFNNEQLARTIAAYPLPIISAVGHEIDFTMCDFVADLRAPTPSAAAELVAESSQTLLKNIANASNRLRFAFSQKMGLIRETLRGASRRLVDPKKKLNDMMLRNDDLLSRMELAFLNRNIREHNHLNHLRARLRNPAEIIRDKKNQLVNDSRQLSRALMEYHLRLRNKLESNMALLDSVSPLRVVARGYSIVTKSTPLASESIVIKSARQIKISDKLNVKLAEGTLAVTVDEILENQI